MSKIRVYILALAIFSLSQSLWALCQRPQPRLLRAEYAQSDAVVIAHLVRSQHIYPKNDDDYHLHTFEVEKILRGSIDPRFVLRDENNSGRVAFTIRRRQTYLLFVDRQTHKGSDFWVADGCGHSGAVSQRRNTLREIERVTSLHTACITGQVDDDGTGSKVNVTATSKKDSKRFRTRISAMGSFSLDVPPGEYSVTARDSFRTFATDFLSYEDAEQVKLDEGGCAQIWFVPRNSLEALKPGERKR